MCTLLWVLVVNMWVFLTRQGLDAGALEEASRAVLVVPFVGIPAVVHLLAVLLLDVHVVVVGGDGCHVDPALPMSHVWR